MRPNAWVGLAAIIIGVVYSAQAYALPRAPIGDPMAPLYFPLGLGVFMIFLGAISFIIEAKKGLNSDDKEKRPKFKLHSMKLIFYVIILCLLYTIFFDHAGFVLATLPFLMIMLQVVNEGRSKVKQNLIITVVFTFGMWYIFSQIFQISLPSSPFGIF